MTTYRKISSSGDKFSHFLARYSGGAEDKGFTLIELLVVMGIISLLASMVLASLNTARARSRATKLVEDFRQVSLAVELVRSGRLIDMTGSSCSSCACGGPNMHTIGPGNVCYDKQYTAFVTKIGMSVLPRDPWGNIYAVDENEQETGPSDCRFDQIFSAGPDHNLGSGADNIIFNISHFLCVP